MSIDLQRVGEELASAFDESRTREMRERVRARIVAGAAPRVEPRPVLKRARIAALLAAAMTCAGAFTFGFRDARPLTFAVGDREPIRADVGAFLGAPTDAELAVSFSDGSRLALAPRSRARVTETNVDGARVLLESGKLRASLARRARATWQFDAGPFAVRSRGPSFDIDWEASSQTLSVRARDGELSVTGCNVPTGGRRVLEHESLVVTCTHLVAIEDSPATTPEATSASPAPPVEAPAIPAPRATPKLTPKPLDEGPRPTATPSGADDAIALAATPAELLVVADNARFGGNVDRAQRALLELRRRFPGTPGAATAAYELGRLAFDVRHSYRDAATWFETFSREDPTSTLAREALGRQLEAVLKIADQTRAEKLAEEYVSLYPNGPHSQLAYRTIAGRDR